jgi:predicted DNA-binding transcriptional regulator YafY
VRQNARARSQSRDAVCSSYSAVRLGSVPGARRPGVRRRRTAARLAAWLEVSTRTVKRDLAALQQAGLPVWAQPGPGGGYVLNEGTALPPVNLVPAQATAIAVALAPHQDGPYAVDGRAALEKILDVMDAAARERAERLSRRGWVQARPAERPAAAAVIEQGLAEQRTLTASAHDRTARLTVNRTGSGNVSDVIRSLRSREGELWCLMKRT